MLMLFGGIFVGGYMFSHTQPRSLFSLHACESKCYKPNELAGLLASVGITTFGTAVLPAVFESDRIVVIKHPDPTTSFHEVILPKKDIKNISEIAPEDMPYLEEIFAYIGRAVKANKLERYRLVTNGPGYQSVTYLHFHLTGNLPKQE